MAGPFGDTFVEASDTALQSHTPTGANPGTSWNVWNGAATVDAAADDVRDNNTGIGNRANMTDAMGDDEFDVQANVSFDGAGVGSIHFAGPVGRAASAGEAGQYEFAYDWSIGVNGSWTLDTSSLDEAWPGNGTLMKLQMRDNDHRGFAGGVEKVSVTNNLGAGNQYGGLLLGNFNGSGRARADNFLETLPGAAAVTPLRSLLGVGI